MNKINYRVESGENKLFPLVKLSMKYFISGVHRLSVV